MAESVNRTLTTIENNFKSVVVDNLVKAELAALYADQPWTAVWPIRPILEAIANFVVARLYKALALVVDIADIKIVDSITEREYKQVSVRLAVIAHNKGVDSDEFRKAREDAKAALSAFLHVNQ